MKIRKKSGTAILDGNVIDSLEGNSTTNAPSQRAVNEIKSKFNLVWEGPLSATSLNNYSEITIAENVCDYDFFFIEIIVEGSQIEKTTLTLVPGGVGVQSGSRGTYFALFESYRASFVVYTDGYNSFYFKVQEVSNYNCSHIAMSKIIGVKL